MAPFGLTACSTEPEPQDSAVGAVGESVASLFDPLKPPTQLTVTCQSPGTLTAAWSQGSVDSGTTSYQIYVGNQKVHETADRSFKLTNLPDGAEHAIMVTTLDKSGHESIPTATLVRSSTATVDADSQNLPPFLTAVAAAGAIQFRWAHPGRNGSAPANSYQLFRVGDPRPAAVLTADPNSGGAPDTSVLLTGCIPYKNDEFYLMAVDGKSQPIGEALNRVRVAAYSRNWPTFASLPPTPDNVSATRGETGPSVTWDEPNADSHPIFGYNIFVNDIYVTQALGSTSASIPAVKNADRYNTSLIAVDMSGYSSAAATLDIDTPKIVTSDSQAARFTNVGADIIDPDGKRFTPVGANLSGMDYFWNETVLGQSGAAADDWRWNTIRLGCGMSDWGSISGGYLYFSNNDLKQIVEEYTGRKIVVILAQFSKGNAPNAVSADGLYNTSARSAPDGTGRSVEEAVTDWWVEIAKMFHDNPYVWINPINEPGSDFDKIDMMYRRMLTRIRAIAPLMPILLDAANFANDIPNRATIGTGAIGDTDSFVLSKGTGLAEAFGGAKGFGPIVFSIHVYSRWPVNYGGSGIITDEQLADRMRAFVSRANELALPLLVGETGVEDSAQQYDSASVRVGLYEQGSIGGRAVGVWQEQGIGVLVWHASPSSGMAVAADNAAWSSVTDVSLAAPSPDAGVGLWNYSHLTDS